MIAIELFPCSGGMAEGFRRAGIRFDFAFDWSAEAVESYAANLGHRPIQIDVRDLVRMARAGWSPGPVDLLVADPPCTPWSRAGKRKGLADERDMLRETVELIGLLRPRAYLIGNVPGLEDAPSWKALQRVLAPLSKAGYCVLDFAVLDAADYGVPQHRVRPFWFGHLDGPCIRWPERTHADPKALGTAPLPGMAPLKAWVTCREALGHLPAEDLGRPVRLRWKSKEHENHAPSSPDSPARTLTKNTMGDGALLAHPRHPVSEADAPSRTVCAGDGGGAGGGRVVVGNLKHPPSRHDAPAYTIGAKDRGAQAASIAWPWDRPSTTILADPRIPPPGHHGESFLSAPVSTNNAKRERPRPAQGMRVGGADVPGATVTAKAARVGAGEGHTLEWPWERPSTTVCAGIDKIAAAGEHEGHKGPNAIVLSERAASILQGFPDGWLFAGETKKARWAQIGMAMPPPLAAAVASSVVVQRDAERTRVA